MPDPLGPTMARLDPSGRSASGRRGRTARPGRSGIAGSGPRSRSRRVAAPAPRSERRSPRARRRSARTGGGGGLVGIEQPEPLGQRPDDLERGDRDERQDGEIDAVESTSPTSPTPMARTVTPARLAKVAARAAVAARTAARSEVARSVARPSVKHRSRCRGRPIEHDQVGDPAELVDHQRPELARVAMSASAGRRTGAVTRPGGRSRSRPGRRAAPGPAPDRTPRGAALAKAVTRRHDAAGR